MANPSPSYFLPTGDSFVDGMTHGFFWSLDSSRQIDFSVSNGFYGEYFFNNNSVLSYVKTALSTYGVYANLKFNEIGIFQSPYIAALNGSEINVSLDGSFLFFNSFNSWARGIFPDATQNQQLYFGAPGDVYVNLLSEGARLRSYDPGSQGWFLLLHELGHTLGLKHPHDDGGTGRPTFSQLGMSRFDIDIATVMSYDDSADWNRLEWDPASPMILDVLALQYLYGKNLGTFSGNSNHSLTRTNFYLTLWDASGDDTISLSNDGYGGWTIELPSTTWSKLVDTKVGFAVPSTEFLQNFPKTLFWLAGDYEHVVGSSYADTITGNQLNNKISGDGGNDTITGGGGNDSIDGGDGLDTMSFRGELASYTVSYNSATKVLSIVDKVSGRDGIDSVYSVEYLTFSDVTKSSESFIPAAADDYSATTATSGSLTIGGSTSGSVEVLGDKDWFKVVLVAGRAYKLGAEKISGGLGDPYITLFSGAGTQLAQDDDSGEGLNAELIYTPSISGTHYLEVKQSPSTYATNPSIGGYTLRASELSPTYQLTSSASSLNEGASTTFNLSTTNVAAGTAVPYTITGVSASDVVGGVLSGSFTIGDNGKASIAISITADNLTEGSETLTMKAGGNEIAIIINDTSKTSSSVAASNEMQVKTFMTMKDVLFGEFSYLNYGTRTTTNTVFGTQYTVIYGTLSGDVIVGTTDTDWIAGYAGKDNISAGAGNDHIFPGGGGDFGDAGDGLDTLHFGRTFDSYMVYIDKGYGYTSIIDKFATPAEGVCTFSGVERIEFSDTMLAVDTDGAAGKAYRVYKAAFARDPMAGDKAGLGYWIKSIDNGMDMAEVAARFIDSPEFRGLYGQNPSNADFLTKVYTNVLGRTPDQGGYSWWLNELNSNPTKTKAKVLADFAESLENKDSVASLIGNGIQYLEFTG
jgi:Ca2+-binding RTX toxin-like protein